MVDYTDEQLAEMIAYVNDKEFTRLCLRYAAGSGSQLTEAENAALDALYEKIRE